MQADGTAPDISGETMDILHALGFRVGCDAVLFTKVVRMIGFALARHVKPTAPSKPSSHIVQVAAMPTLPAQLISGGQVCSYPRLLQPVLGKASLMIKQC